MKGEEWVRVIMVSHDLKRKTEHVLHQWALAASLNDSCRRFLHRPSSVNLVWHQKQDRPSHHNILTPKQQTKQPDLKNYHLHSAREQMSPFYFKFQFRNVEYSSGRNKTLLCFRVDSPGGNTEPLKGYMEDEHATAHAEEAFFQQVTNTLSWSCYM